MKNTKTTIRELSAKYRSILKKCFLMNAMLAVSAVAITTGVRAEEPAATPSDVNFAGKYFTPDDTTTPTGDVNTTPAGRTYEYTPNDYDGTAGVKQTGVSSETAPTKTLFKYTGTDGNPTNLSATDPKQSDYTTSSSAGDTSNVKTSAAIVSGVEIDPTKYQYKGGDDQWIDYNPEGDPRPMTAKITLKNTAGTEINIKNGEVDGTDIEAATYTFHLDVEGAPVYSLYTADDINFVAKDSIGMDVVIQEGTTLKDLFDATVQKYKDDLLDIGTAKTTTGEQWQIEHDNFGAVDDVLTADGLLKTGLDTDWGTFQTASQAYTEATSAQTTAKEKAAADTSKFNAAKDVYNAPILQTIDTEVGEQIAAGLDEGGAIAEAIATATDDMATQTWVEEQGYQDATQVGTAITTALANEGDAYQTASEVSSSITTALANDGNAYQTASDVSSSISTAIGGLDETINGYSGNVSWNVQQIDGKIDTDSFLIQVAAANEVSATDNGFTTGVLVRSAIDEATTLTETGKNYEANTSVIEAIQSLDGAIGDMSGFGSNHYAQNTTSVAANITALDDQVYTNTGDIATINSKIGTTEDGTYVASANTIGANLNALDRALATADNGTYRKAVEAANYYTDVKFNQLDRKIDKLEDRMEKGLAANAALAGLTPLPSTEHKTQLSAAMGGYGSNQALAVGGYHYINDRTLLNAGAAYGGNSDISYKVGVTFGF